MTKYQIQRYQIAIPVVHAASSNTSYKTPATINLNGILMLQKLKSSAAGDGSATITLNIYDADGDKVYSKATLATNTTTLTDLTGDSQVPLSGLHQIEALFSAGQSATDQTVTVTLLIQRG